MVDGPTLVAEALASGAAVLEVYAEPDAPADVLDEARRAGVAVVAVAEGALAKVTSPVSPQPVAALVELPTAPDTPLGALRGLVLVLVGVGDPGNAGTLVRVSEAAGVSAVVSCADGVDPWNPKCVRASAGSIFRVPVHRAGEPLAVVEQLRTGGVRVIACDLGGAAAPEQFDLRGDVAILLGNEAHGLASEVAAAADAVVTIPMAGRVESLNVAMSGTVLAFEAARQRRHARQETTSST